MTLYEKSLNILELQSVLELLAAEAVSVPAKEAALKLRPSGDRYEVERRLGETTAAKEQMVVKGSPSFSEVKDVSASLSRAEIGGMLNTAELLEIAGILKTARNVQSYYSDKKTGRTDIDYLFAALRANKYLEEKITTSIIGEDEISDSASGELADIRRKMRIAGDKVRQALQRIITSPTYAKSLQEPIITMRNDRYVVPVKAEHKSMVPGLVHDISSSGATLFIEPMSAVRANNEIRELLAKEKKEIERILMALSAEAADNAEEIACDFSVLTSLDLIFAKAKLSFKLNASEPEISENNKVILRRARHPLLPKETAVPIDVRLGGEVDTMVITGPNTGGKTVTLKTIGLLCVMGQCGLHIPVNYGSSIPIFKKVFADIGDEQSIEQSLSTFSSHMTNIVNILGECSENTLVLFDELGAGTDPVEGAALAIAVIEYARQMGAEIAATTHYAELKVYATSTEGVVNASCEFDVETLRPTYRLLVGIPGKSNAFAISARLGLPDTIIEDAKARIGSESKNFESVLENLEQVRQQLEREKTETDKLLIKVKEDSEKAEKYLREAEEQRSKAVQSAKREAESLIEEARRAADSAFDELNKMRREASKDIDWQRLNEAKTQIKKGLNEADDKIGFEVSNKAQIRELGRPPKAGDTVEILSIGTRADVISVGTDGVLTLQAGIMKITAGADEVRVVEKQKIKTPAKTVQTSGGFSSSTVRPELDVRGMTALEAIPVIDRYIDGAQMTKLNEVTIIHGKGTGALRAAVHQSLKGNRQVKSFRLGRYGEGEAGVTVVTLK